ncbi:hypothetical protein C8R47DRAFT_590808 [Mycena vitilis]|nr:hypothetical protein C8R47DRAFT_590808 [Mycena vitilis]
MSVERWRERAGRMEARSVAEVVVTKRIHVEWCWDAPWRLLIDNCASTPLVVLALLHNTNGVGVMQGMHVLFHAPAPAVGSLLQITISSISMSARCEVFVAHLCVGTLFLFLVGFSGTSAHASQMMDQRQCGL